MNRSCCGLANLHIRCPNCFQPTYHGKNKGTEWASGGTVYTRDLKSLAARLVGSNPTSPTKYLMTDQKISYDSETPAVGQQVIVACAFIHHTFDGVVKVFLAQRAMTKKFLPGVFEIPGGHIDFGEDVRDGLKREVQEELHKEITLGGVFSAFTYLNEVKGAHAIEVTFFAEFQGGLDDYQLHPADHMAAGWFSEDDFETFAVNRDPDDQELAVIKRGFALLNGASIVTA
jgi:8-oxo-dGTP diphosphatase